MGIREEMDKHEKQQKGGFLEVHFTNKVIDGVEGVETHVVGKTSVNQMKALIVALGIDLCKDHGENPIILFADLSAQVMMSMGRQSGSE